MAANKTKPTKASVTTFLNSVEDRQKRADCRKVAAMMREATGARAKMWGANIVGFGRYHYKYASGREGDWFLTGFMLLVSIAIGWFILKSLPGLFEQIVQLGNPVEKCFRISTCVMDFRQK